MTFLAVWLLSETVGWRRWAATGIGFIRVFYYHFGGAVLALGPAIYYWQTPTLLEFGFIAAIAVTSTVAMTCGIRAYSVGEVSIVGPVEYVRPLFAAILGYAVFAETPGLNTWIGAAIIISATFYIARCEAVRKRAA